MENSVNPIHDYKSHKASPTDSQLISRLLKSHAMQAAFKTVSKLTDCFANNPF